MQSTTTHERGLTVSDEAVRVHQAAVLLRRIGVRRGTRIYYHTSDGASITATIFEPSRAGWEWLVARDHRFAREAHIDYRLYGLFDTVHEALMFAMELAS